MLDLPMIYFICELDLPYNIIPAFKVESFIVEKMDCNLLENIHGWMVVLCGQTLLYKGIIANSLENFCIYWLIRENHETFSLETICNIRYIRSWRCVLGTHYHQIYIPQKACELMHATKSTHLWL